MPCDDSVRGALNQLRVAWREGRLAHAYLIVGSPRGIGRDLAVAAAQLVLCTAAEPPCGTCRNCRLAGELAHADVHWLEPESRSRQITIGDPDKPDQDPGIRFGLIEPLVRASVEGGWKVGVVLAADRMTLPAANALLKTLEEPPARTLLLLVSDEPQRIPATILSRCQRVVLRGVSDGVPATWRARIFDLFAQASRMSGELERMALVAQWVRLLEELEADCQQSVRHESGEALDADTREARARALYLELRRAILREWMQWERDVLIVKLGLPRDLQVFSERQSDLEAEATQSRVGDIERRLEGIELMDRRLQLNMSPATVLSAFLRQWRAADRVA